MLATSFGFSAGFAIQLFSNSLQKRRWLARPWFHVAYGLIGGYVGYNYSSWELSLLEKVNEKRLERGMPPIKRGQVSTLGSS